MRDVDGVVIIVESAESDDAPNSPDQVHYPSLPVMDRQEASSGTASLCLGELQL